MEMSLVARDRERTQDGIDRSRKLLRRREGGRSGQLKWDGTRRAKRKSQKQ